MKSFIVLFVILYVASASDWFKCGQSKYEDAGEHPLINPQIVGGVAARPNEFPYQVALKRGSPVLKQFCAGTVLNQKWILSAAHCVERKAPSSFVGVVGDHLLDEVGENEKVYSFEKVIMHPKYNVPTRWSNDFALLKVNGTIELNEDVWPACSPQSGFDYAHEKAVVSGWGTISPGGPSPNNLLYTTVNVTTNEYCRKYYKPSQISDDMLCCSDNKGSTERDACAGDSGGPLVVKQKNGQFALIGVVSWGRGCASAYPGVYARVNYVEDWILDILKKD